MKGSGCVSSIILKRGSQEIAASTNDLAISTKKFDVKTAAEYHVHWGVGSNVSMTHATAGTATSFLLSCGDSRCFRGGF